MGNILPTQAAEAIEDASVGKAEASPGLLLDDVMPIVLHCAQKLIGGTAELRVDAPLMDNGMDSLSVVAFRNTINKEFQGVNIPSSVTVDYPSVAAISQLIVDRQALLSVAA